MEQPKRIEQKSYEIPEEIRRNELEVYDRLPDGEFWTEKNLEYWFARDSAFGAKLALGFKEVLGNKLEEDTPQYEEFSKYGDIMELGSSTTPERAHAAMYARKWVSKTFGISLKQLTARNIATRAYMSEAEAMRDAGFDINSQVPFSFGSGLKTNKEHRNVKRILQEDFEKMKVKTDSDLANQTTEIFAAVSPLESEIAKLAIEFQKTPGLFENYIQWLDNVASIIGQQRQPAEIIETLRSIGQAEHKKSLSERNLIAQKIICIRQMKKNLREHGVADDMLSDDAFQKWLKSKKSMGQAKSSI